MPSGEVEAGGKVPRQRNRRDLYPGAGERRGTGGEDAVPRADSDPLEALVRALILQNVEQREVSPVRARPPEVAGAGEGEGNGPGRVVTAGDDLLIVVEARHDLAERRHDR